MSFTGNVSFGNYDRTAQLTGSPLTRQTAYEQEEEEEANRLINSSRERTEKISRTRTNSVDAPRSEKDGSPENATDTAAEDEDDDVEEGRRNSMVQALARKYTSQSQFGIPEGANAFTIASDDEDSPLNPNGPNFNSRAWAKSVVNILTGKGHMFRTSGVAYQNLNVHGFGSTTDYQKDVVNIWLDAVGLVRKLTGHTERRIDILRNFDGLVRSGELLVVLGPPGSGCSTFLKTISGDHNGIFVDDNSYFNYQGESQTHPMARGAAVC